MIAVYVSTITSMAAAFAKRRAYAAAFLVGLLILSAAVIGGIADTLSDGTGRWVALLSVGDVPLYVNDVIFGEQTSSIDAAADLSDRRPGRLVRDRRRCGRRDLPRPLPEALAVSAAETVTERTPIIRVDDVSKWFGSVVAVSEVSFDVYPGITGLLGPNGAGKTTLLRMITGLADVSQGEISVFGGHPRTDPDLYRRIGVMVEHEGSYDFLSGRRFVELAARLRKVDDSAAAATRSIERVNLGDAADRPIRTYSRGMRQRIRLAATLVHEPELLILDEPLNGADPRQRVEFQELLLALADEGRTILISSHVLEEVELLASRVLLVVNGKLAAEGDFHAIRRALDDRPYQVRVVLRRAASARRRADRARRGRLGPARRRHAHRAQQQRRRVCRRRSLARRPSSTCASPASSRSTTRSRASSATSWSAER